MGNGVKKPHLNGWPLRAIPNSLSQKHTYNMKNVDYQIKAYFMYAIAYFNPTPQ